MAPRLQLENLLREILGTANVYFQPPATVKMVYPCIIYQRDSTDAKFADNSLYQYQKRYQVTVIDRDPDSAIPDKIAALPLTEFNRFYVADNLNHDVFHVFF